MKRILYLLIAFASLLPIFSSCNDDKDVPQVSLQIDYTGAISEDGTLYVVSGDTLSINALRAIPDEGTKPATISSVAYDWDGIPLVRTNLSPFPIKISTADIKTGDHYLGVYATVLQVDKPIGFAITRFPIVIVADKNELPDSDKTEGTISPETYISDKEI